MNKRQELIDSIGEAMMGFRGYKKGENPVEWDPDSKDSQLSMVLEDVEFVVDELSKRVRVDINEANLFTTTYTSSAPTVTISTPPPPPCPSGVKTSVRIEITTGHNPTIEDIIDFAERLQRLKVDTDNVLHGSLRFVVELPKTFVDRIDCGECGVEDFLVYSEEHPCND